MIQIDSQASSRTEPVLCMCMTMFVYCLTMFVFVYDNVDNICLQYNNVCLQCLSTEIVKTASRSGHTRHHPSNERAVDMYDHKTSAPPQPPPRPYPLPYFVRDAARANAQASSTTLVSGLVPEHAATKKRSDTSRMPPLYDSDNVYDNVCLAYDNVCIYV